MPYSWVGDDKCDSELDCYCEEWSACRTPPVPACCARWARCQHPHIVVDEAQA
jgi:hypothetical protein